MLISAIKRYSLSKSPVFLTSFPYSLTLISSFHSHPPNPNNDICHDVVSFNRLIHMRPPPSIVEINKLLASITNKKHYPTAISLCKQAQLKGFAPNLVTLNILLNCFCDMGQMAFVFPILAKIIRKSGRPDLYTFNIMLDACLKLKDFDTSTKLFKLMDNGSVQLHRRKNAVEFFIVLLIHGDDDISTYNTTIDGLCDLDFLVAAIFLFFKMKQDGITPNSVTFDILIRALLDNNKIELAKKIIREKRSAGYGKKGSSG